MLKRVYIAQDEFTALTLKEILQSQKISAIVRRFETSWLDGLPKMMHSGWGEILVEEKDSKEAEEIIQEFLENTSQQSNQ